MLPYNTGKYHETPEGIPMLHAVDHSLTETMLSLSPSSQFMYEPEVMDSTMCGQSQGSAGPPNLLEINSGEDFIKSEGIISPTVEGMTFQDYPDPEALFSPPADGLVFNDCLQLSQNLAVTAPGMMFEERVKQEDALYSSVKLLGLKGCERLQPAFVTSLGDMSFGSVGQKTGGGFDMLSDVINLEDRDKLNSLIPSTSEVGGMNVEGIGNDWFELDKDLYEMSKDNDILLQDPVFSRGPTLTQLNSKDLDSTCLDEYSILDDLYSKTFPLDHLQDVAPTTIVSKFPSGIPGVAVMSPKFTTCTVTSFVNSVTTAGGTNLPEYPAYIANELLVNQELCQLRNGGVPDSKPKLLPQSQWASIFAAKSGLASIPESSCYVPVLRNLAQVDDLIGAVVVAGGGAVSLVVTEQPVRPPLPPVVRDDSLKNSPDDNWEEIERFLLSEYGGKQPVVKNVSVNKNQTNVKVEPQAEATFAAHEEDLSDKESMLEDSDVENEDLDNSDEDESVGKSDNMYEFGTPSRKDKKYFWQYNTQSKGPKGKRLCKSVETNDPHVLHDFEDPVFDPEQNQTRYKHNGKARRGDGNDVTPNPHKLFVTGNELKKLNKLINGMMPSSEMPASARAKLLKEKNKYASRACRLKKKAQHEANKLKLHGLELEHRQLMKILVKIKKDVTARVCRRDDFATESLSNKLESLISKHLTLNVAGRTADYVNSVLQQVAKGDRMGGICLDD